MSEGEADMEWKVVTGKKSGQKRGNKPGESRANERDYTGVFKKEGSKFICIWTGYTNTTKFSNAQGVRAHILSKHFETEYICDVCSRVFNVHSQFLNHYKTHTNPEETNCDICMMSFAITASKKTHDGSDHHDQNVEAVDEEKLYYSTHLLPSDPFDLGVEEEGSEKILDVLMEKPGLAAKVIESEEGEVGGTYGCVKQRGQCRATFHRLFRGQKGCVRVKGHRIRVHGRHSCQSRNYIYCVRDRKSKKYYYFGQSKNVPGSRFTGHYYRIRTVSRLRREEEKRLGITFMNDNGDEHQFSKWVRDRNAEFVQYRRWLKQTQELTKKGMKQNDLAPPKPICPFFIQKVIAHFSQPGRTFRDLVVDIIVSFKDSTPLDRVERWFIDQTNAEYDFGLNDEKATCWEKVHYDESKDDFVDVVEDEEEEEEGPKPKKEKTASRQSTLIGYFYKGL